MHLGNIADLIDGRLEPPKVGNFSTTGIAFDTRKLSENDLFFALSGEKDGHEFVGDARGKGAVAAVVSRKIDCGLPQIIVRDTLEALGKLAAEYRKTLDQKVICVTGSLGKTTTREAISEVLSAKYEVTQSQKNFNNFIGLPYSILSIDEIHDVAVLEIGINLIGEMARLAEIANPDFAVVLNIAPVHLEGLGNIENIAGEKLRIFDYLSPDGKAFLNADDLFIKKQNVIPKRRVVTFGFSDDADFQIQRAETDGGGCIRVKINGRKIGLAICGLGAAYTAACAWAVGAEFGISEDDIIARLEGFVGFQDRLKLRRTGEISLLVDVYNSSPIAVQSALETLISVSGKRKIAVLGDMLELGDDSREYHIDMGRLAVERGVERLFFFGELSKDAIKGAFEAGMAKELATWTDDFDELKRCVLEYILPGDVVLVKGSRAMRLERLVEGILGL